MSLSTFDTISISGNSSHKGLAYFYNPVKIESSLDIYKNLSVFGNLETNSLQIGSWTLQNEENSSFILKNESQFSNFKFGNNLTFSSNAGIEKLSLGNFSILDKFKETQLLRNDIPVITFSKDLVQIFGKIKCDDFLSSNCTIRNLNADSLSINKLSLNNDLVLSKEKTVVFPPSTLEKPTLGKRSIGSKIVLLPSLSNNLLDYSIGLEQNGMWFSLPMNKDSFKWNFYAGTNKDSVFSISGTGNLEVNGDLKVNGKIITESNQITSGHTFSDNFKAIWTKNGNVVTFYLENLNSHNLKINVTEIIPFKIIDLISENKNFKFKSSIGELEIFESQLFHTFICIVN